ncbi:MAG: hypothetical protein AAGD92_01765 [Pseudomonadota bacterium]
MNQTAAIGPKVKADDSTAFIIGNGPSLKGVSLVSLSEYATIGMNAAYRYWRQIDWRPQYYACVDLVVGLSHKDAITELIEEGRIKKFLLRNNVIEELGVIANSEQVVNFDAQRETKPLLSMDPPTTGAHAALWAGEMGYKKIVLLGIDLQYKEIVEGAEKRNGIELEIVEKRSNPNYFFDDYQQPGDRYNIPNPRPDLHLNAWRQAAARLEGAGVQALNANRRSALRCLPFIELNDFLKDGALPSGREEPLLAIAPAPEPAKPQHKRGLSFLRKYATALFALAVLWIFIIGGWAALTRPTSVSLLATLALSIAGFMAATAFLYVRHAILAHLQRQDSELAALRARISDLERTQNSR